MQKRTFPVQIVSAAGPTILFVLLVAGIGFASFAWVVSLDRRGTYRTAAAAADLDGDGDLDVLLHHVRSESEFTAFAVTTLWFNHGNGRFEARRIEGVQGEAGWASAAGDADLDGDTDLYFYSGARLRLLANQGAVEDTRPGKFEGSRQIMLTPGNGQFGSILLGDLNGDGWLDGVVLGCCGRMFTMDPEDDTPNTSWLWTNAAAPGGGLAAGASEISAVAGLALSSGALGDLDVDGDLDLFAGVVAPPEGRNRDPADRVLINDGLGVFSDSGQRLGQTDSFSVALADLDGDGDLDSLVGTRSGALVWINQGGAQGGQAGVFRPSGQGISGDQIHVVLLADLDGDGDPDALLGGLKQAVVWWNNGKAAFTASGQHFRLSNRYGWVLGDFNGDGLQDIFAAAYSDGYRLWMNDGTGNFYPAHRS